MQPAFFPEDSSRKMNQRRARQPKGDRLMLSPSQVLSYVKAQPFRPFRLNMASGKNYDIRHPEMIRVGKSLVLVFSFVSGDPDVFEQWESVSLMLTESISQLDQPVMS
jgi:hypothetical protein